MSLHVVLAVHDSFELALADLPMAMLSAVPHINDNSGEGATGHVHPRYTDAHDSERSD